MKTAHVTTASTPPPVGTLVEIDGQLCQVKAVEGNDMVVTPVPAWRALLFAAGAVLRFWRRWLP